MGIACGAARAAHSIDARLRGTHMNILTVNLLLSTLVFGIAAKIYILPKLHRLPVRTILLPILLLHSRRHLCRNAAAVRLSGRLWRSVGRRVGAHCPRSGRRGGAERPLARLAIQYRGHARSDRRHHARHCLRGPRVHGARLLDTGVLGSGAAGNALHHLCPASSQAPGGSGVTSLASSERSERISALLGRAISRSKRSRYDARLAGSPWLMMSLFRYP